MGDSLGPCAVESNASSAAACVVLVDDGEIYGLRACPSIPPTATRFVVMRRACSNFALCDVVPLRLRAEILRCPPHLDDSRLVTEQFSDRLLTVAPRRQPGSRRWTLPTFTGPPAGGRGGGSIAQPGVI